MFIQDFETLNQNYHRLSALLLISVVSMESHLFINDIVEWPLKYAFRPSTVLYLTVEFSVPRRKFKFIICIYAMAQPENPVYANTILSM